MASIYLENLKKDFGNITAVNDLCLKIKDRELLVFLGPSGCGKTTTLNCIAGLEKPTSGRIYFDDRDITDYPPHVRNISMVFQNSLVYPHLTARRNIEMSLKKSKLPAKEVKERIDKAAKLLHIEKLLDKLPSEISGGERQRIATAKAIVKDPDVFLMDEPLASLDAALRETLRVELVNVQKKSLGVTMVFVTHDQVEAMTMGDRIAVMKDGNLQQVGKPEDIYNQPANLFIAGFIGSPPMNFFEGVFESLNEEVVFVSGKLKVPIPDRLHKSITDSTGKNIILGVRPQNLGLRLEESPGYLQADVFGIERLGKEQIIIMEYENSKSRIKAIVPPRLQIAVGDKVFFAPLSDHIYLFDKETENNICL